MRLFNSESLYNVKTGKWEERFWIDGVLTDSDLYFYELEREKELEQIKFKSQEVEVDPCEGCKCKGCCEEEFDYEDILDIFVGRILDTGGCPGCIREILDEFADMFLPDDEEIDENEVLN